MKVTACPANHPQQCGARQVGGFDSLNGPMTHTVWVARRKA